MASAIRVFRKFRASDGRIKIATLSGVSTLVAVIALLVGVLPVMADHDENDPDAGHPLVEGVQVDWGGGRGACDDALISLEGDDEGDARGPSAAKYEAHLQNPKPGDNVIFGNDPDETEITITVHEDSDKLFDFSIKAGTGMVAYDVVVNGGEKSNHYEYDGSGITPSEDFDLHAPTKKNKDELHNLSHINICYDELFSVSGTKYHDRDADGTQDESEEFGLEGWTVAAFDSDGDFVDSAETDKNGSYTIDDLARGSYTICEQTDTDGLPDSSDLVTWAWTQSQPSGDDLCSGFSEEDVTYEPLGYTVEINGNNVEDKDFGNHRQVSVTCDPENDVVVTLDAENDEPAASVTFPAGCQSGVDGNDPYTASFDLGLSTDGDDWKQFVVFSGDPESTQVLTQTIEWAPEPAEYNDDNELVVPTTQVLFDLSGTTPDDLVDVTFCHDIDGGDPTEATPQCLDSRLIAEGGDVPDDHIQVTEHYKLLGDPGNFR